MRELVIADLTDARHGVRWQTAMGASFRARVRQSSHLRPAQHEIRQTAEQNGGEEDGPGHFHGVSLRFEGVRAARFVR